MTNKHMSVPFVDLKGQYHNIQSEIDAAIKRVIEKGQFIGGEEVEAFENEFATYLDSKHCVSMNSGTDALILGVRALNLPSGSEVILPANTFYATALAASENNLKPVFTDIDENDFGMDLSDLKKKINGKTKAVIAVHLYGQPDKMDEVQEVIKQSGKDIYLIEDAAQTHGAKLNGKRVGTTGIFAAFSFYPGKNLGAYGDGGALTTHDDTLARKYRLLREYGSEKKYYHSSLGRNSRLDTLQAAILRIKLQHLDKWNSARQKLAAYYTKELSSVKEIQVPHHFQNRESIYHVYVIRAQKRDELQAYLSSKGITTIIHYPVPLHVQEAYAYLGYKKGDLPKTEKACEEILSLPMYPEMTTEQVDEVIKTIKEFYQMSSPRRRGSANIADSLSIRE